ncbi:MAG: hypothetical protein K2H60_03485 [Muribaculaceae bacterium]|nr:hypothetical protein [Muribaculaceae bacterium]
MYSSKDYEKLWQKYQTEGIAKNMTLQMFCSMNNVPYNSFEKYLKTRRGMSDIHPVSITGIPHEPSQTAADQICCDIAAEGRRSCKDSQTRILVNIRMTNGIRISKANLSHRELTQLVEKLEALC